MGEAVFVTGGGGFVGGAVLRHLLRDDREVRALARSQGAADRIGGTGATLLRGDVFDAEVLLRGMRGCSTVFHVAGMNANCLADPSPMLRMNVEGSVEVLRVAAAAGVRRFVHTSSAATIGEGKDEIGNEDSPHRRHFLSQYERSKYLAERRVLQLGRELGVEVVCVNPSSVQGPGRVEGSARILSDLVTRRRAPVADTWLSIVDVDDCAAGHLLAATEGRPEHRYLLSAVSLRTDDAVEMLRRACGAPKQTFRLPRSAVTVIAAVVGAAGRVSGRQPPLCPEVARTLLHGHRYDGSRAQRELGLRYRSPEETLRRTLVWYAEHGLISPQRMPKDAVG